MNILHISQTTLAGAPAMLSMAQRFYGYQSICFQISDIKTADRMLFSPGAIPLGFDMKGRSIITEYAKKSDILHLHGQPKGKFLEFIRSVADSSKIVIQYHSNKNERPQCIDTDDELYLDIKLKLIVAHAFSRNYPDFIPVPNCLFRSGIFYQIPHEINIKPIVILHPSSLLYSRYGNKITQDIVNYFKSLHNTNKIELNIHTNTAPELLYMYRQLADITIDDIISGGFHLVSYEGLACGNIVINGADDISIKIFMDALKTKVPPPFIRTNKDMYIDDFMNILASDRMKELSQESRSYFMDFMHPKRVVELFNNIYESIL